MTSERLAVKPTVARVAGVAIAAFALHTTAWIAHELAGVPTWPRWLELTYLVSLFVWVPALLFALWAYVRVRPAGPEVRAADQQSAARFGQAQLATLVTVLLLQLPFFIIPVPSKVLAQITVTACIVVLYAAYGWTGRARR